MLIARIVAERAFPGLVSLFMWSGDEWGLRGSGFRGKMGDMERRTSE